MKRVNWRIPEAAGVNVWSNVSSTRDELRSQLSRLHHHYHLRFNNFCQMILSSNWLIVYHFFLLLLDSYLQMFISLSFHTSAITNIDYADVPFVFISLLTLYSVTFCLTEIIAFD